MSEFAKMSRKETEMAKAAVSLLRMLGLTDEEIDSLPEVVRGYKEVKRVCAEIIDAQNRIVKDQNAINERFRKAGGQIDVKQQDAGLWERMVGSEVARIDPSFASKGGRKDV